MCNNTGIDLPSMEILECLPCSNGMFYQNAVCEFCPTGYYISDTSYGNSCKKCSPGNYAPKIREYSQWTNIPVEFNSACISSLKYSCPYSWEARSTYLITSPIYIKNSSIILQTKATITELFAYIEHSYKITGNTTRFSCYINGILVDFVTGESENNKKISLKIGEHNINWVCQHSEFSNEACSISKITILGANIGGASDCLPCKEGYFSSNATDNCKACPIGYTSNESRTGCKACEPGTHSNKPGACKPCPLGTISNPDNSNCVFSNVLTIGNSLFLVGNLSGTQGNIPYYCTLSRFNQYCHQTLYGPIVNNNSYFYLSVMSPSILSMPSYEQGSTIPGYAYGILDKNELTASEREIFKPTDNCNEESSKIVVNLGSEVKHVRKTSTGFSISYINGDNCNDTHSFSTVIKFVCDKNEKEG